MSNQMVPLMYEILLRQRHSVLGIQIPGLDPSISISRGLLIPAHIEQILVDLRH